MESLLGVSVLELRTDNAPLTRGLSTARTATEAETRRMGTSWDQVGKRVATVGNHMSTLGSRMTTNVTLPIVAGAAGAIKVFSDFESALTQVETQAGASKREIDNMRGALLNLAPQVGQTPVALANALYHIESAGLRGAAALDVLTQSAKLAAIGHADLEQTASAVVAVMRTAPKDVKSATDAIGLMNATIGQGNLRLPDLAAALSTGVLPAAKAVGLGLRDVGAAIDVMTSRGVPAQAAATRLRMTFSLMAAPTSKAAAALDSVGIKGSQLAADMRKPDGLVVAVQDLKTHLDAAGLSATQQNQVISKAFGGGRSSATIETLIQNVGDLQTKFEGIGKHSGAKQVADEWATTKKDVGFQWDQIKAEAEKTGIELGQAIGPSLISLAKDVAGDAASIAHAFSSLPASTQKAILTGGLVLAATGPALKLLGVFTTGVGRLYDVALIAGKLAAGKGLDLGRSKGLVGGAQSVASMEVAEMIVKSMIGGPGGGGGPTLVKDAEKAGAAGAGVETTAAAGGFGRLATARPGLVAGGLAAGVAGFAAAGGAQGTPLNKLNAFAHGADPTSALHLIGLPALSDLLPAVRKRVLLTPAMIAAAGEGLDPESFSRILQNGIGAFGPGGKSLRTAAGTKGMPSSSIQSASVKEQAKDFQSVNAQLALLEQKKQGVTATAAAVGKLAMQAKAAGDVRWRFADSLTTELLKSRNVASGGVRSLIGQLNKLAPGARSAASQSMIQMTQALETQGRLPKGSTVRLVTEMLGDYKGLHDKTGAYFTGLVTNAGNELSILERTARTSTGKARQDALDQINQLRVGAGRAFDQLTEKVITSQGNMRGAIQKGTHGAAIDAATNFQNYENNVWAGINSGVISTGQGAQLLDKALNATLKAFGAKPIPLALTVGKLPLPKGVFSTAGASPRGVVAAQGALVQFGRPGDAGHDSIPVRMGGHDIVVGGGEVGAVLTRHQFAGLNHRLAREGGLPGYLARNNRPNFMSQGGMVGDGTVIQDPGVNMSVGQEPQILSDLYKLSAELRKAVFVISGYRSPAHSVAVGGFADDPHTRGQAADIGIGGPSLASMFGVTESELRAVGLYRPFYPADAHEVNHVQLIAGAIGKIVGGARGAVQSAMWKNLMSPKVSGSGTVATLVRAALGKATDAANKYGQSKAGPGGISAGAFAGQGGSAGANEALGHKMMLAAGWGEGQWPSLLALWNQESGWNANSVNSSSGAYGIPQALGHGHPFNLGDAAAQIAWGLNYIRGRYGSPAAAEAHERAYNWYAKGGFLDQVKVLPPSTGHLYDRMTIGSIDSPGNSGGFNQVGKPYVYGRIPAGPVAGPWWAEGDRRAKIGTSFGGKPGGQAARFTHGGRSTIAFKADTGDGNSYGDIYPTANSAINFTDNGPVRVEFLSDDHARKLLAGKGALALSKANAIKLPKPPKPKGVKKWGLNLGEPMLGGKGPLPFDATADLNPINQALSRIFQLDGTDLSSTTGSGDAQKMWDLVNWYTQNYWTSGSFPAPNFSSAGSPADFVVSQDAAGNAIPPFISPHINQVVRQLGQAIGWQSSGVTDLQGALSLSRAVAKAVKAAIKRRQDMIHQIRKRIQDNLRKIRDRQRSMLAELKSKHPDHRKVNAWNQDVANLQQENLILGGARNTVGTGGELKQINDQLGAAASGSPLLVAEGGGSSPSGLFSLLGNVQGWESQLGGVGGEIAQQKLALTGFQQNLFGLKAGANVALWDTVAGAAAAGTATAAAPDTSVSDNLASLLAQWQTTQALTAAVGKAEDRPLADSGSLPPFGGSFATGGMVPGMPGEARTIIAHGGEPIFPVGTEFGSGDVHVHFHGKAKSFEQLVDMRIDRSGRQTARTARRRMPGAAGVIRSPSIR